MGTWFAKYLAAMAICGLIGAKLCRAADAQPPATAPADFQSALLQLSSQDFQAREQAVKKLQALLADQTRQQVQIQEMMEQLQQSLAAQIKQLTVVQDPEAQARTAGLLEMQASLTHWVLQVMALPLDQRHELLDWGFSPQAVPVLTRIYSRNPSVRRTGIKELAKLNGPGPDWTLEQLIRGTAASASIAAMAAVYDRPPTDPVINALWYRAIEGHVQRSQTPDADTASKGEPPIEFPEVPTPIEVADDAVPNDNGELATIVLLHCNSPKVAARLRQFIAADIKDRDPVELLPESPVLRAWCRLVDRYQAKEAIPALALMVLTGNAQNEGGEDNGLKYWWSSRSEALATLAGLTPLKLDDYNVRKTILKTDEESGYRWTTPTEDTDKALPEKFRAWWIDHHKQYGVEEMPPEPAPEGK